jgi:CheY-like chemotaxis protein
LLAAPPLASCKVLVVEDDPTQALDLEAQLRDLGCAVLGPAASKAEAAALLRRERPNLALLDMTLTDGSAFPLARRLVVSDVPFAVVTGQDRRLLDHPLLRGMPHLAKPYRAVRLRATVRQLHRFDLTKTLTRTDQHIAQAWRSIATQARIIARLAGRGRDTRLAEELLQAYERTLAVLEERRDLVHRELERQGGRAEFPGWPGP